MAFGDLHPCLASHRTRMTVYPSYSTFYIPRKPKPENPLLALSCGSSSQRQQTKRARHQPTHKLHTGLLTKSARKALFKAANLLIEATPTRPVFNHILNKKVSHHTSFITLTLPFDIDLEAEKKLFKSYLSPLIEWLKKSWGMLNYVWRAERTERGRIHYHLITDCYCPHSELRRRWNKLLTHLPNYPIWKKEHLHQDMPSTEIRGIYDPEQAKRYLSKYLSKKEKTPPTDSNSDVSSSVNQETHNTSSNQPIPGRVWGCSDNLKQFKRPQFQPTYNTFAMVDELTAKDPDSVIFLEYAILLLKSKEYVMRTLEFIDRYEYREYLRQVAPPNHYTFAIN